MRAAPFLQISAATAILASPTPLPHLLQFSRVLAKFRHVAHISAALLARIFPKVNPQPLAYGYFVRFSRHAYACQKSHFTLHH